MWHTSRGDRILSGQEAALVGTSIDTMIDALLVHIDEDFEDPRAVCESGIGIYDAFTASQRLGLLHDVAKYLLTETTAVLPLSAALEATIAAIFVEIRDQVAIEIDFFSVQPNDTDEPTWRQRVLDAYRAIHNVPSADISGDGNILPDSSSEDIRGWECLVDGLADAILWDRDFEMADGFLDADPGVSHQRRRLLGINDDYFTLVAPDPRPDEIVRLVSETRRIVRAKPR